MTFQRKERNTLKLMDVFKKDKSRSTSDLKSIIFLKKIPQEETKPGFKFP